MAVGITHDEHYKKLYDTIVKAEKLLDGDFFKNFKTNVINTIDDQIYVIHILTIYSECHTGVIDILREEIDNLRQEKNTLKDRVKALEDKLRYIA